MGFIENLGIGAAGQAASGLVDAGMGLLLEKHNDKRQIKQQQKLTDMQIAAQKQMGIFNREQQMQMWNDTNYGPQMEHLKKAGLNPALMYGMGGGGGTTASATPGSVSTGQAPQGKAITADGGMGIQMGIITAQKQLMEAQARNLDANTAKTAGADTTKTVTETESISQGIENAKIQQRILELEQELKAVELEIGKGTIEEKISQITSITSKLLSEVTMAEAENAIVQSTKEAKIKQIQAQAIGALLNNILTKAITEKTGQETQNVEAERKNIKNKISQWAADNYIQLQNMTNEQRRTAIGEQLKDSKLEMQGVDELIRGISEILEGVMKNRTGPTRNPVGFK